MKKTFVIRGYEVEFTPCTAIATGSGDTVRQSAIFIHDCADEFGDGDAVIFGYEFPKDDEEAEYILDDCDYPDSDWETLETVIFPDGTTLDDYIGRHP